MTAAKLKRIRDPVHDLIEFGATVDSDQRQLEHTLWRVIQTRPFQRLRRIKQLGLTELVFPGATHTRFAHSLGVFHTARMLLDAIRRSLGQGRGDYDSARARFALAAALLHDVGHGPFSHAFEAIGKERNLPLARHETMSDRLIRDSEIAGILDGVYGRGFAGNVADLVGREQPETLYDSIFTSQFDADRLDYMQRDRMMTGLRSGAVNVSWLIHNLEVGSVSVTADDEQVGSIDTLILGPKSFHVAESYVLALFHLYPNVYLHKATRGAEQVLLALIRRLFALVEDDALAHTGLQPNHPLIRFVRHPDLLEHALALDDAVLWGALPMIAEAQDPEMRRRADELQRRHLLRCIDIWDIAAHELAPSVRETPPERADRLARINLACNRVLARKTDLPSVLFDHYVRDPYKRFQDSRTPPNQIHILQGEIPHDMAELSAVVGSAEPFRICRAYLRRDDTETHSMLQNKIRTSIREGATDAAPDA